MNVVLVIRRWQGTLFIQKRLGQKRLTPRKEEIHENCFSNFVNFFISEGVASTSAVLERETKVFFTFVPRSLMFLRFN